MTAAHEPIERRHYVAAALMAEYRVVTRPRLVVGRTEVLPRISHCYVSSVGIVSS